MFLFDLMGHGLQQPIIIPKVDLLLILFITFKYGAMSSAILFLLGVVHDIVCIVPLGLSAMMYVFLYTCARRYRDRLLHARVVIRVSAFVRIMLGMSIIEYMLHSLYMWAFLSLSVFFISLVITSVCYFVILRVCVFDVARAV